MCECKRSSSCTEYRGLAQFTGLNVEQASTARNGSTCHKYTQCSQGVPCVAFVFPYVLETRHNPSPFPDREIRTTKKRLDDRHVKTGPKHLKSCLCHGVLHEQLYKLIRHARDVWIFEARFRGKLIDRG